MTLLDDAAVDAAAKVLFERLWWNGSWEAATGPQRESMRIEARTVLTTYHEKATLAAREGEPFQIRRIDRDRIAYEDAKGGAKRTNLYWAAVERIAYIDTLTARIAELEREHKSESAAALRWAHKFGEMKKERDAAMALANLTAQVERVRAIADELGDESEDVLIPSVRVAAMLTEALALTREGA